VILGPLVEDPYCSRFFNSFTVLTSKSLNCHWGQAEETCRRRGSARGGGGGGGKEEEEEDVCESEEWMTVKVQ
jgi:hypothetical protein